MLFNTAEISDFSPEIKIENEDIEVVEQFKLLGVQIKSDLRWNANTTYITKKGYKKLLILRRQKENGANESELKDNYCKHVRSVQEYGSVIWHAGLTKQNTAEMERVQKAAFSIIWGREYLNYENALCNLSLKKLSKRRKTLSLKFASKALRPENFTNWFVPDKKVDKYKKEAQKGQTSIYQNCKIPKSAIPYMIQLMNK